MRRECRKRFPRHRLQRKRLVSDPGMYHGTCVTHVPRCISGSLTPDGRENVPGIPGACTTRKFTYLTRGPWHLYKLMVVWYTIKHNRWSVRGWIISWHRFCFSLNNYFLKETSTVHSGCILITNHKLSGWWHNQYFQNILMRLRRSFSTHIYKLPIILYR